MADALVIGCAPCVHDDLTRLPGSVEPYVTLATSRMIDDYPESLDYAVSLHLSDLVHVAHAKTVCVSGNRNEVDFIYKQRIYCNGSSALLAVGFALHQLGARRVICAGCPLDNSGHYWDKSLRFKFDGFRAAWQSVLPEISGRVFSMSGWTRELLGAPQWQ